MKLRGFVRASSLRESPIAILPGQYFDAETGLHQNWHRDYDPSIGRYLQSDPIGLEGGLSTYSYGVSNPVRNIDPQGLFISSVDAACAVDPMFCADLVGQIAQNAADLSGDACLQEEAAEFAGAMDDVAALAAIASLRGRAKPGNTLREMPWSNKSVRDAAKSLKAGATEVRVGSRAEAEELFLGRYQGYGYRNSTGMSPTEARTFFGGKYGTYHWDEGARDAPHRIDHLQVHTLEGDVVRIYFP